MPAQWWSFKRVVMSPVILFYYFSVLLLYYHTTAANTESIDDVNVSVPLLCKDLCKNKCEMLDINHFSLIFLAPV